MSYVSPNAASFANNQDRPSDSLPAWRGTERIPDIQAAGDDQFAWYKRTQVPPSRQVTSIDTDLRHGEARAGIGSIEDDHVSTPPRDGTISTEGYSVSPHECVGSSVAGLSTARHLAAESSEACTRVETSDSSGKASVVTQVRVATHSPAWSFTPGEEVLVAEPSAARSTTGSLTAEPSATPPGADAHSPLGSFSTGSRTRESAVAGSSIARSTTARSLIAESSATTSYADASSFVWSSITGSPTNESIIAGSSITRPTTAGPSIAEPSTTQPFADGTSTAGLRTAGAPTADHSTTQPSTVGSSPTGLSQAGVSASSAALLDRPPTRDRPQPAVVPRTHKEGMLEYKFLPTRSNGVG